MRPVADNAVSYGMGQTKRKVRRVGKWVGLVVVVLVLGVDVAGKRVGVGVGDPFGHFIGIGSGEIALLSGNSAQRWAWVWFADKSPSMWWFRMHSFSAGGRVLSAPLWFIVVLSAAITGGMWRLDRKRRPGDCPACGYDLSGLAMVRRCPECGKASVVTSAASAGQTA